MFESHVDYDVVTSMDRASFDFQFEEFLAIYLCKQSSPVLLSNHPLLDFEDLFQILSPQFSVTSHFLRSMSCSMSTKMYL